MSESFLRKCRTIDVLTKSIQEILDEAAEAGFFEAKWDVPQIYIDKKTYYMLEPIIQKYKDKGYTVEFTNENDRTDEDATQLYFCWYS